MKVNMSHGLLKIFFLYLTLLFCFSAKTEPIEGNSVSIKILDKITAKVEKIIIHKHESFEIGSLKIEIFSCYTRPPEEIPEDFVLLKIYDLIKKDELKLIYQGWMISSSPSITSLEHPIYDVWLIDCIVD